MQLRITMWKKRQAHKTFTCSKCKTQNHLYLLEGEKCPRCYKPPKIDWVPDVASGRPVVSKEPSEETLQLQYRCILAMDEFGYSTNYAFACAIGVSKTSYQQWMNGDYGDRGQRSMIAKIEPALDKFIQANRDAEVLAS